MIQRPSLLVLLVAVFACSTYAFANVRQDKGKQVKATPYTVVKVDNEYRVIRKSGLKALRDEIARDYKRAVKDHEAAKKAAKKSKIKFQGQKPKKSRLKVVKATCKDEAAAQKYLADLQAKEAKKQAKKTRGSSRKKRLP